MSCRFFMFIKGSKTVGASRGNGIYPPTEIFSQSCIVSISHDENPAPGPAHPGIGYPITTTAARRAFIITTTRRRSNDSHPKTKLVVLGYARGVQIVSHEMDATVPYELRKVNSLPGSTHEGAITLTHSICHGLNMCNIWIRTRRPNL